MKKILPYILILAVVMGMFSPLFGVGTAQAAECTGVDANGNSTPSGCIGICDTGTANASNPQQSTQDNCKTLNGRWYPGGNTNSGLNSDTTNANTQSEKSTLKDQLTDCGIWKDASVLGCFQLFTYFIFVIIPSAILGLVAQMFNFLASLTLSSDIYNSGFIENIWQVVRDFTNIFFILILLYAAFEIILGLGHGGGKKTIASVILVALLVNFSLFFTKIIIDASNVTALIFYNRIDTSNVSTYNPIGSGSVKEKDMAGALVERFNINSFFSPETIQKIQAKEQISQLAKQCPSCDTSQLSATSDGKINPYFLISIMVAYGLVVIVLAYAFLIVAMSFLGRMVTLMMLMIVSPVAFVTYTVPSLSGISTIGFSGWIKKLFEASFVAAIFMFILYVTSEILKAQIFKNARNSDNVGIMATLVMIFVPALLIVILLLKGASYAKKASGEFTGAVMSGAKVIGGLALGGAALGTAFIGRTAIGRTTAALSRREGAKDYGKLRFEHSKELEKWKHDGKVGPAPASPKPPANTNILDRLGARINQSQWKSGDVAHARHEMDEMKKKAGLEGLDDAFLSGVDRERMKTTYLKDKKSDIESEIRRGKDAKGNPVLLDKNGKPIKDVDGNDIVDPQGNAITSESDYKASRRQEVIKEVGQDVNNIDLKTGELTDQAKKQVEDRLTSEFNNILNNVAKKLGEVRFSNLQREAQEKVGVGTRVLARTTSGTYDPRNLANMKADKREGIGAKAATGIIAAVALGMRLGLKQGLGVQAGAPKRDFVLDLKETITEALKNVNVKVDTRGGSKGDNQGTSGGGHH